MAEPLSAVLAGMALATAIKDAMEVWEKIEGSFARVSQNLRAAQQLVGNIRSTLDHLSEFCQEHQESLDKSEKTRIALTNLVGKMKTVHATCSRLIPPVSEKRFKQYRLKYYVWKNGRKIEGEIMDLRRDIDNCLSLFAVFTSIRTEARLIEFQDANLTTSNAILNVVSELAIPDARLREFARVQTTIPPVPSLDSEVAHKYLQFQVETLHDRLGYLADTFHTSDDELIRVFDFQPLDVTGLLENERARGKDASLHNMAVRSALEIQCLLQPRTERLSLDAARVLLVKFARILYLLGMRDHYTEFVLLIQHWESRLTKVLSFQIDKTLPRNASAEIWDKQFEENMTLLFKYTYTWRSWLPRPVPYTGVTRLRYRRV